MYIAINKDFLEKKKEEMEKAADAEGFNNHLLIHEKDLETKYDSYKDGKMYLYQDQEDDDGTKVHMGLWFDLDELEFKYQYYLLEEVIQVFNKVKTMIDATK